ncbi:lasso peptide biosynthesis B2 protein [Laspinema palackyanum]|uniref:lasso peptide biosynthesis B2 protein n=1 Tax=Laspinema palackyanum TaxID=3231601 RepID=UPI00345D3A85|nr:lasso peptide biosynthesis B2 protein [Laspinema sp. D2c]
MFWLKLLIRKAYTFQQLDRNERVLLLQALVLLPVVALLLKIWGLKHTQATLARLAAMPMIRRESQSSERLPQITSAVRMVRTAVKYYGSWANCLKKSLVLWYLLRCQGIEPELRIGVRKEAGKFEAHAWVEYEGIVLNDTADVRSRFVMFDRPIKALP